MSPEDDKSGFRATVGVFLVIITLFVLAGIHTNGVLSGVARSACWGHGGTYENYHMESARLISVCKVVAVTPKDDSIFTVVVW